MGGDWINENLKTKNTKITVKNKIIMADSAKIMTVQTLLSGRHDGFDNSDKDKIKMIRLKTDREKDIIIGGEKQEMDLRDIYKYHRDLFEEYIKEEESEVFKNVEYVVALLAEDGTDSRLVGVYENQGKDPLKSKEGLHYYNLVALNEFDPLIDRVIVDWGLHQEQWHQRWNNTKYVIRIDGFSGKKVPAFDSYEDVMLNYSQLHEIITKDDAIWKSNLKSVNCIYGIVDKSNGRIYIGSTYGATGIFGRWKEYADNTGKWYGVELKKQIKDDPNYIHKLQWIILEVLPLKVKKEKAIRRESFYKEKFCSGQFGYNRN